MRVLTVFLCVQGPNRGPQVPPASRSLKHVFLKRTMLRLKFLKLQLLKLNLLKRHLLTLHLLRLNLLKRTLQKLNLLKLDLLKLKTMKLTLRRREKMVELFSTGTCTVHDLSFTVRVLAGSFWRHFLFFTF